MGDRYDVIVIGSGLGGSVCAALLAKAGVKTMLLEKNSRPGGKAMGIAVNGFRSEMWPTFGIPMEAGPFVDAFRLLGIESKLEIKPGSFALWKWVSCYPPGGQLGHKCGVARAFLLAGEEINPQSVSAGG